MNENYTGFLNLTTHPNYSQISTDGEKTKEENRQKISFSRAQTDKLEEAFIANEYLTSEMLSYLSETLSIELRQILWWFENKRIEEYTTNKKLWGPPKHSVDAHGNYLPPPPRNVAAPTTGSVSVAVASLPVCGHCAYFADHSIPVPPPTGAWSDAISSNNRKPNNECGHAEVGAGDNDSVIISNVSAGGINSGASAGGTNSGVSAGGTNSGASAGSVNGTKAGAKSGSCYAKIHPSGGTYARVHPTGSTYTKINPTGGSTYTKISSAGSTYTKISATGSSYTEINADGCRYTEIGPAGSRYTAIGVTGSGFTAELDATGGGYAAKIDLGGGKDVRRVGTDSGRRRPGPVAGRSVAEVAAASAAGRAAGIAARSATGTAFAAPPAPVGVPFAVPSPFVPPVFPDPVDRLPPSRRRRRRHHPFGDLLSVPPEYRRVVAELLTSGQAAYCRYIANVVHNTQPV